MNILENASSLARNFAGPTFIAVLACVSPQPAQAAGNAEHVIIIAWDGLRPDMVNATNTPTLNKLAQTGTFFSRHHAVYPSSTEVNGTALATGMYPANNGLIGNWEYRPKIRPDEPSAMESLKTVRKGDKAASGKYLAVPTIYEMLQAAGFVTVIAGTKPVTLLPDRSGDRSSGAALKSINVFEGKTLPETLLPKLEEAFGKFPEKPTFPDALRNKWTLDVLLNSLWKDEVPKLSLLWLSDPDYTQHDSQPGSAKAMTSLKVNDELLTRLVGALEAKGIRGKTDILVVSDHGFSTIEQTVDFATLLSEAGFRVYRKFFQRPKPGDIMVVGNGGSVFFYVTGHDKETTQRLVTFLERCKFCGVIFSSDRLLGTFPLNVAHINSPDAPDVVVSLRWDNSPNASDVRGVIFADTASNRQTGQGMHSSLSPYDMHNTLIAQGPDFRSGFVDLLPSGNVDVAPTVLWILAVKPNQRMDGRVLKESLVSAHSPEPKAEETTLTATSDQGRWRQYLKISSVDGTEYFDEGNTEEVPK
jgi:arylsulfatase A-like enzyme